MAARTQGWQCPESLRDVFMDAVAAGDGSDRIHQHTPTQARLHAAAQEHATALGMSPPINELYATTAVRCAKDLARQQAAWSGLDPAHRARLRLALQGLLDSGRAAVAVQPESAVAILRTGRVASQFDTRTSGGLLDPDLRAMGEWAAFDLPPSTPAGARPVYGFTFTPGREDQSSVAQYGPVRLVLRDEVLHRTTVTIGDSLNWHARPVAMRTVVDDRAASDASARRGRADWGRILVEEGTERYQDLCYVEAQVHDGLPTTDIEGIVVTAPRDALAPGVAEELEHLAGARAIPLRWPPATP